MFKVNDSSEQWLPSVYVTSCKPWPLPGPIPHTIKFIFRHIQRSIIQEGNCIQKTRLVSIVTFLILPIFTWMDTDMSDRRALWEIPNPPLCGKVGQINFSVMRSPAMLQNDWFAPLFWLSFEAIYTSMDPSDMGKCICENFYLSVLW